MSLERIGTWEAELGAGVRDVAVLKVARVGRAWETGDPPRPFVLLGENGAEVRVVSEFLHHMLADDARRSSLRSYAYELLAWFRFLRAIEVAWDAAGRAEARDFALWLKTARKPARPRRPGAPAPGTVNPVTGNSQLRARFPARPAQAWWPQTAQTAEETLRRLTSPPFLCERQATRAGRRRGVTKLLHWLASFPGDTWQQRWLASAAEGHPGASWVQLPLGWLREHGLSASYDPEELPTGLLMLVCGDVIRPGREPVVDQAVVGQLCQFLDPHPGVPEHLDHRPAPEPAVFFEGQVAPLAGGGVFGPDPPGRLGLHHRPAQRLPAGGEQRACRGIPGCLQPFGGGGAPGTGPGDQGGKHRQPFPGPLVHPGLRWERSFLWEALLALLLQ